MKKSVKNWLLFLIVIIMFSLPLMLIKDGAFEGADGQAVEVISDIDPEYQPWFSSFIEPKSGEIESLLFSLQAGIGAGVIGYFFGYMKGKRKAD